MKLFCKMSSYSGTFNFTCLSCRVTFQSADLQRDHYKSEWHRYNLKRKVADLPPVTDDAFGKIEEQHQRETQKYGELRGMNKSDDDSHCKICGKHFNNEKSFEQHIKSKKHADAAINYESKGDMKNYDIKIKENELKSKELSQSKSEESIDDDDDGDWESVDDNDEDDDELTGDAIPSHECLFCSICSDNIENNLKHMTVEHSFFIPDAEFLIDLEGLITYLGEKIGMGYRCLWCCDSGKRFASTKSVQRHMIDKGHAKLKFESGDTLLEYSDFYDYSLSYPDADDARDDEEVDPFRLDGDGWQLTLPSGATIGHRSLFRYYKQNLKPKSDESNATRKSAILNKVLSQYRSLGWTGTTGESAIQKAKDIKYMQKWNAKNSLIIGQKHNRVLQTHFRRQN